MEVKEGHAVDAIVDIVMAAEPGEITICPLGPLTNIGKALVSEPRLADRIGEIILMGGGFFEGGNVTPAAEFNIYVDPQAADIVFRSGVPITMMPLDVTHKALTSPERLARFAAIASPAGKAVHGMLDFFERFDIEKYGMEGGPLHDPCVIAYLLDPDLFGGKEVSVLIETSSEVTMGMTVVDWWGVTAEAPNATVMRHVDADGFFELLADRIARL
jgi:purine nucleosidase